MKLEGFVSVRQGTRVRSGKNTLLWAGVASGLSHLGSKEWVVSFLGEGAEYRNSYLEDSDYVKLQAGNLGQQSKVFDRHTMRVVFSGYPQATLGVEGLIIHNKENVAISVFKFRQPINLEGGVKVEVLWRVSVGGLQ